MTHRSASTASHTLPREEIHAELYRQIANHLPGGAVFVVNHAFIYLLADGEALAEVGMIPADLEGKTVREVVGGEMADQAEADYRCVLNGHSFEREHAVRDQFFLSRGTPLRGQGDKVQAALVISCNITHRVHAENALKAAEIQKDRFLAMLVHEMRGPLTPLLMGIELLKLSAKGSGPSVQPHAMMERQVRHLLRLVEDLSDQSRLRLGKLNLDTHLVTLKDVIDQALEATSLLVRQKGHTVINHIEDASMQLQADPARLVQVFTNLIHNAAKYSPKLSIIELAARQLDKEVEIEVKDNGNGIPSDQLLSVFDLFTQLAEPPEATGKGLGIGLALVKGLVEAHGGHVKCYSEGLGKGSSFLVSLPLTAH